MLSSHLRCLIFHLKTIFDLAAYMTQISSKLISLKFQLLFVKHVRRNKRLLRVVFRHKTSHIYHYIYIYIYIYVYKDSIDIDVDRYRWIDRSIDR